MTIDFQTQSAKFDYCIETKALFDLKLTPRESS